MTTVTLTEPQVEQTQRAILEGIAGDMRDAASLLDSLASLAPWPTDPTFTTESNAFHASQRVRDSLALLDALGWPSEDQVR